MGEVVLGCVICRRVVDGRLVFQFLYGGNDGSGGGGGRSRRGGAERGDQPSRHRHDRETRGRLEMTKKRAGQRGLRVRYEATGANIVNANGANS